MYIMTLAIWSLWQLMSLLGSSAQLCWLEICNVFVASRQAGSDRCLCVLFVLLWERGSRRGGRAAAVQASLAAFWLDGGSLQLHHRQVATERRRIVVVCGGAT